MKGDRSVVLGIVILCILLGCGCLISTPNGNPPVINPSLKCGFTTCNGIEVSCGDRVPEVCPAVYQIGDKCQEYVDCYILDGKCETHKTSGYYSCKMCVEKCIANSMNATKLSECEQRC